MANLLLKRIKDWATSITAFRTGDVIPVDGPSGTAKMSKDTLLELTTQNALAGNVAQEFDASKTPSPDGFSYHKDDVVSHQGLTYLFVVNHVGAWDASHVVRYYFDGAHKDLLNINSFIETSMSSEEFTNILPDNASKKFKRAGIYYNAFIFDVGKGMYVYDIEVDGDGDNLFAISVQTDSVPSVGDGYFKMTRSNYTYMEHRYLIITVRSLATSCSIKAKPIHCIGRQYKSVFSDTFAGIIPNSSTNRIVQSSNSYDAFLFDVGAGVKFDIEILGGKFTSTAQIETYPQLGNYFFYSSRQTSGITYKRYLMVVVEKRNYPNDSFSCIIHYFDNIDKRKKIKALFIGNSVCQDHVMYCPWFLKNSYGEDLTFEIANFYIASYTIKSYVQNCIHGNKRADIFSQAYNTKSWINRENSVTLLGALMTNDWDLVCVQGYYNNGVMGPEDMSYLSEFVNYIQDNVNKPVVICFLMHQTYRAGVLSDIINGAKYAVKNSAVRLIFPCGLATEFVKGLWQQNFLTSDGIHNQEGLPCILGGYVVGDVLARYVGLPSRIVGDDYRMTLEEHNELNIAGQNGSFQAGTEEQYDQAQIAASRSINAGLGVLESAQIEMIPQE